MIAISARHPFKPQQPLFVFPLLCHTNSLTSELLLSARTFDCQTVYANVRELLSNPPTCCILYDDDRTQPGNSQKNQKRKKEGTPPSPRCRDAVRSSPILPRNASLIKLQTPLGNFTQGYKSRTTTNRNRNRHPALPYNDDCNRTFLS